MQIDQTANQKNEMVKKSPEKGDSKSEWPNDYFAPHDEKERMSVTTCLVPVGSNFYN